MIKITRKSKGRGEVPKLEEGPPTFIAGVILLRLQLTHLFAPLSHAYHDTIFISTLVLYRI